MEKWVWLILINDNESDPLSTVVELFSKDLAKKWYKRSNTIPKIHLFFCRFYKKGH